VLLHDASRPEVVDRVGAETYLAEHLVGMLAEVRCQRRIAGFAKPALNPL